MTGVFLGSAYYKIPVVIDGFISAVAALIAVRINPIVEEYLITSHASKEIGYKIIIDELGLEPMLNLDMRLGEGSGCPIAFSVVEASCAVMNNMATFEEADINDDYIDNVRDKSCYIVDRCSMNYLILGGSKSGKSMYGQNLARDIYNGDGKLYYVATMKPCDKEDEERIQNHIKARLGYGFHTIECNRNIISILEKVNKRDIILIDSLTSLLVNEMFNGKEFNKNIYSKIANEILEIGKKVRSLIVVSDYIFSNSFLYDNYTNEFLKELSYATRILTKDMDYVFECSYGKVYCHKEKL